MDVFCYGTLAFDEVWKAVLGRLHPAAPARAPGVRRRVVLGEVYPAVVPDPESAVEGVVRSAIAPADLARLDRFEGDAYQRREALAVLHGGESRRVALWVWADPEGRGLGPGDWDPAAFRARGMRVFLDRYEGFRRLRG